MQELEASWGRVVRIWWLLTWRSVLGAIVIGGVSGGILGFVVGMLHLPMEIIAIGGPILGAVIGLGWWVIVMRMALRKKYSDFRIALVPRTD